MNDGWGCDRTSIHSKINKPELQEKSNDEATL